MTGERDRLESDRPVKKAKVSSGIAKMSASDNPYLAHMYGDSSSTAGTSISDSAYGVKSSTMEPKPRQTTTAQAEEAEDGPLNWYTNRQLSKQYFDILAKRRDLPVHAQR